ncbi:Uncharacterized protein At4g15970 [Linum perenne]
MLKMKFAEPMTTAGENEKLPAIRKDFDSENYGERRRFLVFLGVVLCCTVAYVSFYSSSLSPGLRLSFSAGPSTIRESINTTPDDQTLATVLRKATRTSTPTSIIPKKTVILVTITEALARPGSILDLFLESFWVGNGTQELLRHLVIVSLDDKAHERCQAVHPHCYKMSPKGLISNLTGDALFMTQEYLAVVWRKIELVASVLQLGYDLILTDADIMWFRNPFPHLTTKPTINIQVACDRYLDISSAPNTGFLYMRSNTQTIRFANHWYKSKDKYPKMHDQDVFSQIIRLKRTGSQIRFLDTAHFGGFCEPVKNLDLATTMHANCCVGMDTKIHDLRIVLRDWKHFSSAESDHENSHNQMTGEKIRKDSAADSENGGGDHRRRRFILRPEIWAAVFLGVVLCCTVVYVSFYASSPELLLSFSPISCSNHSPTSNTTQENITTTADDQTLITVLQKAAATTTTTTTSTTPKKTVILVTITEALARPGSMLDLFLESFWVGYNTQELLRHLVIVSLDDKAHERCQAVHTHCYKTTSSSGRELGNLTGDALFMTQEYLVVVWRKIELDADIMWFRNPFPHLAGDPTADVQVACDSYRGSSSDPNTGFFFARSNNKTVQFVNHWYESRNKYPGKHDQDVFNRIIRFDRLVTNQIEVRIRFLDTAYFGGFCEPVKDLDLATTMHANCCVGMETKVRDLRNVLKDWKHFSSARSAESRNSTRFEWKPPSIECARPEPGSLLDIFMESFWVGNGTQKLVRHLVIVTVDDRAHAKCQTVHPHCYRMTTPGFDFSNESRFMTGVYLDMMWRRLEFLGSVLRLGYDFVFTNPFPHFDIAADFHISADVFTGNTSDDRNSLPSCGFMFFRSNVRTIRFHKFWYDTKFKFPIGTNEQDAFNRIKFDPFLDEIGLRIRFLDTDYFGGHCSPVRDLEVACTMHANCLVGLETKLRYLRNVLDDWRRFASSRGTESRNSSLYEWMRH